MLPLSIIAFSAVLLTGNYGESVPNEYISNRNNNDECPPITECIKLNRHHCRSPSKECGDCWAGHKAKTSSGICEKIKDSEKERGLRLEEKLINRIQETKQNEDKVKDPAVDIPKPSVIENESPVSQNKEPVQFKVPKTAPTQPPETHPTPQHIKHNPAQVDSKNQHTAGINSVTFIVIVAGCSVAGLVGVILAGVCWYKIQKNSKAASDIDYPAYGVTGPNKERGLSPGDRKLAQSAQMYHYQHTKQQMLAMERANGEMKHDASEEETDEENEEGDYTVYECPGLAPTGEMEVKNPLFNEDVPTPADKDKEEK